MNKLFQAILLFFGFLFIAANVLCGEMDGPGRQVLDKGKSRIISVKIIASTMPSGEKHEIKLETQGIIVNEKGLALVAFSSIDPIKYLEKLFAMMGLSEGAQKIKDIPSNIDSVKYVLGNGKEVNAKVAITDKYLDIAVLKPETDDIKYDYFEVAELQKPAVFDPVIIIFKTNSKYNRELAFLVSAVNCVISKPIDIFMVEGGLPSGYFVFNRDSKFIGMTVNMSDSDQAEGGLGMGNTMLAPIVPARDIVEVIKQVK